MVHRMIVTDVFHQAACDGVPAHWCAQYADAKGFAAYEEFDSESDARGFAAANGYRFEHPGENDPQTRKVVHDFKGEVLAKAQAFVLRHQRDPQFVYFGHREHMLMNQIRAEGHPSRPNDFCGMEVLTVPCASHLAVS